MFQTTPSGIVLFAGATDWDEVGRKTANLPRSKNTIWSPKRLAALADIKVTFKLIQKRSEYRTCLAFGSGARFTKLCYHSFLY